MPSIQSTAQKINYFASTTLIGHTHTHKKQTIKKHKITELRENYSKSHRFSMQATGRRFRF